MFTGIVTALGSIRAINPIGAEPGGNSDMRLVIHAPWADTGSIALGASIACSGCCLTAVEIGADWFAVDVSAETLSRTTMGTWRVGSRINLERSLKVGDELGGHIVSGHVDGIGHVSHFAQVGESWELRIQAPVSLARYLAYKGSITVNGVSLTVNQIGRAHV